jgi:LmbE family N-acetylglucosaminyl deacetylase
MSHPYNQFIDDMARLLHEARRLPLGGLLPAPAPVVAADAPKVLVFSPHPDDESIIGALPLRLRRELSCRVSVVAVTQGSKVERQAARLEELRGATAFLGLELIATREGGLTGINPKARAADPTAWGEAVALVAGILAEHRPLIVFFPHSGDGNPTHIGTHHVVMDALATLGPDLRCLAVETEFWIAMPDPNLMVQSTPTDVADLVAAITFHVGEVARNPYHVLLPSWMSDNVRRGGELIAGFGGALPDYDFATLYRLRRWNGSALEPVLPAGRLVPTGDDLALVFGHSAVVGEGQEVSR